MTKIIHTQQLPQSLSCRLLQYSFSFVELRVWI